MYGAASLHGLYTEWNLLSLPFDNMVDSLQVQTITGQAGHEDPVCTTSKLSHPALLRGCSKSVRVLITKHRIPLGAYGQGQLRVYFQAAQNSNADLEDPRCIQFQAPRAVVT